MKSIVLIVLFGCISHLFILKGQDLSYTKEQEIISWIQRHAFPIEKIGADVYITDLEPMEQILTGVRVVGMGELSHGTGECYQFEHRLFDFLVKRMGFKAVAIEASTAACEPINEYVLYNKGTLTEALTGQGYSLWDTEEMSALIEWMRSYNQRVPNTQKVQFFGIDLGFNELGRKRVSTFVEEFLPEWSARIDSIFGPMTIADPKMPMRMNEFKDKAVILLPKLQAFSQYLETKREALIMASSLQDFEKIKQ